MLNCRAMTPDTRPEAKPLGGRFYTRPTLDVARDLLGRTLLVAENGGFVGGRIVEVEAYIGEDDPACHAYGGPTPRTTVMYGDPGHAYVYFTYGHHWMLNVVTERRGYPAAVLIRAIEPLDGIRAIRRRRKGVKEPHWTNGPGKLTAALGITGRDNGADLRASRLVITGRRPRALTLGISGRVGVSEGGETPWRFYIADNPWVSAYRKGTRASRKRTAR